MAKLMPVLFLVTTMLGCSFITSGLCGDEPEWQRRWRDRSQLAENVVSTYFYFDQLVLEGEDQLRPMTIDELRKCLSDSPDAGKGIEMSLAKSFAANGDSLAELIRVRSWTYGDRGRAEYYRPFLQNELTGFDNLMGKTEVSEDAYLSIVGEYDRGVFADKREPPLFSVNIRTDGRFAEPIVNWDVFSLRNSSYYLLDEGMEAPPNYPYKPGDLVVTAEDEETVKLEYVGTELKGEKYAIIEKNTGLYRESFGVIPTGEFRFFASAPTRLSNGLMISGRIVDAFFEDDKLTRVTMVALMEGEVNGDYSMECKCPAPIGSLVDIDESIDVWGERQTEVTRKPIDDVFEFVAAKRDPFARNEGRGRKLGLTIAAITVLSLIVLYVLLRTFRNRRVSPPL